MKNLFKLLLLAPIIAFWGCEDKVVRIYDANTAVTISFEDWRKTEPKLSNQSQLKNPGKIYMYKNALYINERGKGIHVYDNSDPSNPIDKGFVKIHSNYDVAVKGNTLYASSYTDILLFDVSNPLNPVYLSREKNVFDVNYDLVKEGYDEKWNWRCMVQTRRGIHGPSETSMVGKGSNLTGKGIPIGTASK